MVRIFDRCVADKAICTGGQRTGIVRSDVFCDFSRNAEASILTDVAFFFPIVLSFLKIH